MTDLQVKYWTLLNQRKQTEIQSKQTEIQSRLADTQRQMTQSNISLNQANINKLEKLTPLEKEKLKAQIDNLDQEYYKLMREREYIYSQQQYLEEIKPFVDILQALSSALRAAGAIVS